MKTQNLWVVALILASSWASAAPLRTGERIVRDPVSGDYTAYYWEEDEQDAEMYASIFRTATNIDPTVRSRIKLHENWNIFYEYKLANGGKAKQALYSIDLYGLPVEVDIVNADAVRGSDNAVLIEFFGAALIVPNVNWYGSGSRSKRSLHVGWHYNNRTFDRTLGIKPGSSQGGFGFVSSGLPGVSVAQLLGNTWPHNFNYSGEGPDQSKTDIARQMDEIVANDFVPRNIAAPLISVPTPFDPAIVLDNLRTHVATWPSKQLADATLAAQLDAEMIAVANAYRANQPQVARDHIEIMLDLIRREHKDLDRDDDDEHDNKRAEKEHARQSKPILIDRLAARVLDFDLKYVLKRMKKDDEREHERGAKKSKQ